jgi:threonine/homoserine/homoserine lactone efflux protein
MQPVTGSWVSELPGLIPLALVISLSPLSIIPAVLVLHAPRPRPTGLAFLGGWLVSLAVLTAVSVAASSLLGGPHKAPTWASWLRVVLGSALIVFGIYRWLNRHGHSESPAWMRSFTTMTPVRAGVTGAVLAVVRLEVLVVCLAVGFDIGSNGLSVEGQWICAAFFVVLAGSSVAIPILAYAVAGHHLDDQLTRLKDWMERHNAALLAVVLIVIGLMVLYNGIDKL